MVLHCILGGWVLGNYACYRSCKADLDGEELTEEEIKKSTMSSASQRTRDYLAARKEIKAAERQPEVDPAIEPTPTPAQATPCLGVALVHEDLPPKASVPATPAPTETGDSDVVMVDESPFVPDNQLGLEDSCRSPTLILGQEMEVEDTFVDTVGEAAAKAHPAPVDPPTPVTTQLLAPVAPPQAVAPVSTDPPAPIAPAQAAAPADLPVAPCPAATPVPTDPPALVPPHEAVRPDPPAPVTTLALPAPLPLPEAGLTPAPVLALPALEAVPDPPAPPAVAPVTTLVPPVAVATHEARVPDPPAPVRMDGVVAPNPPAPTVPAPQAPPAPVAMPQVPALVTTLTPPAPVPPPATVPATPVNLGTTPQAPLSAPGSMVAQVGGSTVRFDELPADIRQMIAQGPSMPAAPSAPAPAAANADADERVNTSTHRNEAMRLNRFMQSPAAADFPHMSQLFNGSSAVPWFDLFTCFYLLVAVGRSCENSNSLDWACTPGQIEAPPCVGELWLQQAAV